MAKAAKGKKDDKGKPKPKGYVNMGLGRLKGTVGERKSRLDAEIERQSGGGKKKGKGKK